MSNSTELQTIEKLNLNELIVHINHLIANDFSKLVYLLYAVDVSEKKLKALLAEHPNEDAGKIIAHLILERQEQKRKSREQFKQAEENIPDDEKW
jgi:hypothetical protein